jgi:hypothetical protein
MSDNISKQNALTLLNFNSIDELNVEILNLAKRLEEIGKEVPREFQCPEKYQEISKSHLKLMRDFKRNNLVEPQTAALPAGKQESVEVSESNGHQETTGQLTVTDDEILDLAASTGVELDVVMSAAEHVESLEALVKWVEKYKQLEEEQAIEDSARQQFELDQLRKKEQELGERLNAAINKPAVNVAAIRQRLGVKTPQSVTNLGKWDGKPGSSNEPDFLKNARAAFSKKK